MSRFSSYLLWLVIIQNAAYHHSILAFIIQMLIIFIHVATIINLAMVIKIHGAVIIVHYMAYHHTCDGISSFIWWRVIKHARLSSYKCWLLRFSSFRQRLSISVHHSYPTVYHHTCIGFHHTNAGSHHNKASYHHTQRGYQHTCKCCQHKWCGCLHTKMFVKTNNHYINSTFNALWHATVTLGTTHLGHPAYLGKGRT